MPNWLRMFRRKAAELPPAIEPEDDDDRVYIREMIDRFLAMIDEGRTLGLTQVQATYRWLLASLLALNGGAGIALASAERLQSENITPALAAFAVGCVLGVVTGLFGAVTFNLLTRPMGAILAHALDDRRQGRISSELQSSIGALEKRAVKLSATNILLGVASLASFGAGCLLAAPLL